MYSSNFIHIHVHVCILSCMHACTYSVEFGETPLSYTIWGHTYFQCQMLTPLHVCMYMYVHVHMHLRFQEDIYTYTLYMNTFLWRANCVQLNPPCFFPTFFQTVNHLQLTELVSTLHTTHYTLYLYLMYMWYTCTWGGRMGIEWQMNYFWELSEFERL